MRAGNSRKGAGAKFNARIAQRRAAGSNRWVVAGSPPVNVKRRSCSTPTPRSSFGDEMLLWPIVIGIESVVLAYLAWDVHKANNDNSKAMGALLFWAVAAVFVVADLLVLVVHLIYK